MLVYYILWGITFFLSLVEVYIFSRKESWARSLRGMIVWLIWAMFVFLIGFKGNVGTDYASYQNLYETVVKPYSFTASSIEPLFWLWMKICSCLALSFPLFWLLTAILNISLKIYIFRNFSPFVSVSILIYIVGLFFERDFDGIRQGLSIGLCYWACLLFLNERRPLIYNSVIVCAVLMHYTAILFFCIPLLSKLRLNKKIVFLLILIGFIPALTKFDALEFIFDLIGMDNLLYDKMYSYTISEDYSSEVGINIGLIFRIIILFLFIWYEKAIDLDERFYNLLKNGFLLSILLSLLFSNFEILSHRLGYGFREFQIFIIPYLIIASKGMKNKLIVNTLIAMYSFVLLTRLLSTPHLTNSYIYRMIF